MNINERKKTVRNKVKSLINDLDNSYCQEASKRICSRVISLQEYDRAETVFCFVGVGGEPDTRDIINDALSKGKRLCVPLCVDATTINAIEITGYDDLVPGFFGLLEPKAGLPVVDAKDIDFAVIPCVTCDHKGNRLGHGRGYYDRYLEGADFDTCMICFEKLTMLDGDIPLDEFDKPIDRVVTDAQ